MLTMLPSNYICSLSFSVDEMHFQRMNGCVFPYLHISVARLKSRDKLRSSVTERECDWRFSCIMLETSATTIAHRLVPCCSSRPPPTTEDAGGFVNLPVYLPNNAKWKVQLNLCGELICDALDTNTQQKMLTIRTLFYVIVCFIFYSKHMSFPMYWNTQ